MIPQKLTLKNFLSYREATLDFSGLHTACICGSNGSGKSSLLEAMAWAIWGESRAESKDDIIYMGELETQVDFIFISQGNLYRVIRNRRRGQSGALEFQVATTVLQEIEDLDQIKFRTLTEKGIAPTQQKIIDYLKLDYDTFTNSAYLRQGKADEFMIKRPAERKEILANLLKLDQYDGLSDKAKDLAKSYKSQAEILEQTLTSNQVQIDQKGQLEQDIIQLQNTIDQLQEKQAQDRDQYQQLQAQQHHRQSWEKLLTGQQQQHQTFAQDYRRLQQELVTTQQQRQELEAVLKQETEIQTGYNNFITLQTTEETLSAQFKIYQDSQQQRQQLQEQQRQHLNTLQQQIQGLQARLEALTQQEQDYSQILSQKTDIEAGLEQLKTARNRLTHFDQLQLEVTPILQQRQRLQTELDRAQSRQQARLEELKTSVGKLQRTLNQHRPQLEQQSQSIASQIIELDKKKVYQLRVREKGQERHGFIDRLNTVKRDYEEKLGELDQKIQLLSKSESEAPETEELPLLQSQFPPCPLCDRPLDEHHWNLVISKQQNQQQEFRNEIWVIHEQLVVADRELKILQEEYRQIQEDLLPYEELREQRGKIQAQLESLDQDEQQLQQLILEEKAVQTILETGDYATDLYAELRDLEQKLSQLNYNEQSHALARNEEKRYRWAEIKYSQIRDAQDKLTKINTQKPELETKIQSLTQSLTEEKNNSEIQQKIIILEQKINPMGYNVEEHNRIRTELRQAQIWLTRTEQLNQAKQQYPILQKRLQELETITQERVKNLQAIQGQIELLQEQLKETPDPTESLKQLEQLIQQQRLKLDHYLGQFGSLQQQQTQLDNLNAQQIEIKTQLDTTRRQYRVYDELAKAFGKNGIQALMIENVLPQLEAETNQILSRLSSNQLHVQFVTQRTSGRGSKSSKNAPKMIETLEILIADARGTRSYETYSGGEAFRINFAIRLALAKLLAQRAGTSLQMLIIDEGFGTQDAEGCDRLIAAINAIASDFACILTVTHIPSLKEAFQARIEVHKTSQGSQIYLSI
ncbi:Nuclease SbcCD subunit C [Planktothrix agardhii]|uniref:Nuclease SbcCD subunit C n=2 Tax=Planktothrix agardhii TaxID=1160 RepID=A0A1J1JM43_PLAAG|nr:exonuclease subunit SbcC [Planktothrix agardhii]AQY61112.1 exonuclease SbcC [Planktothrix agardhii NIVA-CYA 68]CAD5914671.1 Nuclease SbcCD subunit C [Planktothrix agardhii]CUM62039.1 Exonuclease SbcC [Planktothrix agardhii]